MAASSVIVFGPTGNIGSWVARTAEELQAKVFLAMRDTSKAIPGLSSEREKTGNYERVEADLTKPETLTAAITKSGAKRAFVYLAPGSPDHTLSTYKTLKSAGIDFIVYLSSYTVWGDREKIPFEEFISFIHAQSEMNLERVFGPENYVAIRPGGFATNSLHWRGGIAGGQLKLYCPSAKFDGIVPEDMGRVSGQILVNGPQDGDRFVYLFGPQKLLLEEAVGVIGSTVGKEVKITPLNDEEGYNSYIAGGLPPPAANHLAKATKQASETDVWSNYPGWYEQGVSNVKKYTGKDATSFRDWVGTHKHLYIQ